MTILNPCCCISLQKGSKIVAILDIILASIPLIVFLTNYMSDAVGDQGRAFTDFNTGVWTIFIVFITADIGLSILLLYGASTRCTRNLKAWFYIRIVTTGLTVLMIIITACFEVSIKLIIYDVFYTLYRIYTLWVVYVFIGEIVYQEIFYTKKSQEFPSKPPAGPVTISIIGTTTTPPDYGNKETLNQQHAPLDWGNYGTVNSAYVP